MVTPPCAACGTPSARIELVAPGQLPAQWEQWPSTVQGNILRQREPGQWYLLVTGLATDNGYGDPIDASRAGRIAQAFRSPLRFAQVHAAGFYDDAGFCPDCDAPYCYQHWHVSETGYGYCPHGHGKSLDPHWSPLAVDHRMHPTGAYSPTNRRYFSTGSSANRAANSSKFCNSDGALAPLRLAAQSINSSYTLFQRFARCANLPGRPPDQAHQKPVPRLLHYSRDRPSWPQGFSHR